LNGADVQYFQIKAFDKSLQNAMLRGGQGQNASVKVRAILGGLDKQDPFAQIVTTTNHGENRISHCVKYDLGGGWRLVTVQNEKTCGFLFMGNHHDTDRWLDVNRGQRFAVENGRATLVPGIGAPIAMVRFKQGEESLFELLPPDLADHVLAGVSRSLARKLEALTGGSTSDELGQIVSSIDDVETRHLILAVFNQLMAGNVDGAVNITKFYAGAIPEFDELEEDELLEVQDGPEIRRLRIGSPEYEEWLNAFEKRNRWDEWFLFLHPAQEKVVQADYLGPAQLSGVSGSGKTCVAVRRALRLAHEPNARVLLVTLNRSLAGLLKQLVEAVGTDDEIRERVEVTSFFEIAQKLLGIFEPGSERIYQDVTWKLNEHVDEVFREYYRQWLNCYDARVLVPLHYSMSARDVSGETYVREEFDWIRSAVGPKDRGSYLEMERRGRRFPILTEWRKDILKGLQGWEAKMEHVGVIDYLGLTSALLRNVDSIQPAYSHILIDEAQDFGTSELLVLRKLVPEGPNDIFLCGDVAQTILPKHRSLPEAGIPTIARAQIVQNYRNSREILTAAYELLRNNLHEDLLDSDDLEILDPRFANFGGNVPMALMASSLEEEIAYARAYADTKLSLGAKTVCIGFAGFSARDVRAFAGKYGVTALDGAYDPSSDSLVFSDLEQTKGYEFDTLIIVQCTDTVLPPQGAPIEEAHRAACKLYVSMTRARRELILSFHGTASPWITAVGDSIATDLWNSVEELKPEYQNGVPEVLSEFEPRWRTALTDVLRMAGTQFLYTSHARGLSVEAQQQIEKLVDGRGRIRGGSGRREKWADMGSLLHDLEQTRMYDAKPVGPAIATELRELRHKMKAGLTSSEENGAR
jgi:hypothetical protein